MLQVPRRILVRGASLISAGTFGLAAYLENQYVIDVRRGLALVVIATILCALSIVQSRSEPAAKKRPSSADVLAMGALLAPFVVFFVLASTIISRNPPKANDIYLVEQESAATLVRGINPYGETHIDPHYRDADFARYGGWGGNAPAGRLLVGYAYLPASLLALLPGYLLGDVRFSLALATLATVLLAFWLQPSMPMIVVAAWALCNALTVHLLSLGVNDSLTLAACAVTIAGAIRQRKWTPLAFGVLLALKQYNVLAIPAAALLLPEFNWRAYRNFVLQSAAVAAGITLPFLLWNPRAFIHDTLLFHLRQPMATEGSISFARVTGHPLPLMAGLALSLTLTVLAVRLSRQHPAMFAAVFALSVSTFFVFSKQGMVNYYFLAAGLMMLVHASVGACKLNNASDLLPVKALKDFS